VLAAAAPQQPAANHLILSNFDNQTSRLSRYNSMKNFFTSHLGETPLVVNVFVFSSGAEAFSRILIAAICAYCCFLLDRQITKAICVALNQ
jgi:hypothetical protein